MWNADVVRDHGAGHPGPDADRTLGSTVSCTSTRTSWMVLGIASSDKTLELRDLVCY